MIHEVATLVHPIGSSEPAARAKVVRLIALLEVPQILLIERRPYLASVAINNFWRGKALHDKKVAGDFVLVSATSVSRLCRLDDRDLVMHGAFCDQPWPRNNPGDDPGLSRTVARRRTRLTPCACPMFCDHATLFCDLGNTFPLFCRVGRISQKCELGKAREMKKKCLVNNDP